MGNLGPPCSFLKAGLRPATPLRGHGPLRTPSCRWRDEIEWKSALETQDSCFELAGPLLKMRGLSL
jgi:hypothetical protein